MNCGPTESLRGNTSQSIGWPVSVIRAGTQALLRREGYPRFGGPIGWRGELAHGTSPVVLSFALTMVGMRMAPVQQAGGHYGATNQVARRNGNEIT